MDVGSSSKFAPDVGFEFPNVGMMKRGRMEEEASRVSASRMRVDDDDEEDDAVVLELRQLKAREQDREARERARLAKMVGALNGEFAPPLPINLSHKPAAGFSVRPDRPMQAASQLYRNSGAPTAQKQHMRSGLAGLGDESVVDDEREKEQLIGKARATASRFSGTFRRLHWDTTYKGHPMGRTCWFMCRFGHEFLASVSDLEKHERVWSHLNWCPTCEKNDKIRNAERFNGRPDNSWADFFERVEHIRPESHQFAESKLAAEQADLFKAARKQVQSGKEAAPDWWDIDVEEDLQSRSGRPSAAEGGSARANAGDVPERNPAQEVDRRIVLALHPDKNPHPKAKDAFTAIQQGFEQLSTLQAYNKK